jgi:SUKH-4 immunity protein
VHRTPAAEVDRLPLSRAAKSVLVDVGLPSGIEEWFAFIPDAADGRTPSMISLPGRPGRWCRFGWCCHGEEVWCIDPSSGAVMAINLRYPYLNRLVNSTLPAFAEFLYEYKRYLDRLGPGDSLDRLPEERGLLADFGVRLLSIDDRALADEDSEWWMRTVYQRAYMGL